MSRISTIGIVGSGTMGRGIAQISAVGGLRVKLSDTADGAAEAARDFVVKMLDRGVEKGRMSADDAAAAKARIEVLPAGDISPLADCDLVVEAIVENLDIKRRLFAALEAVVSEDCILATNTSSLSVTAIAAGCDRPARVAGFHFFNPVPLMKIVEVVSGVLTDDAVRDALVAAARRMGHAPVLATDTPGFLVNHAGRGFVTEALRVHGEGIADFVDIDRVMREAAGFRMGPFELLDLMALDVSHPVMESIFSQFYGEPRFRPSPLTRQRLTAGLLGRKTGRGFYLYEGGKQVPVPEESAPAAETRALWVSGRDPELRERVIERLKVAELTIDDGDRPGVGSVCIVTPIGEDATTAALAEDLDPTQTVAVDALFGLEKRITLMVTPVTDEGSRDAAHAALAKTEVKVTVIRDSAGFIAQRVVATIVNIGCDIAQQGIASPEDIDMAVRLGLGYPRGPLAFGDAVGPQRILAILEAMQDFYGDPRYRPSPWLKRRARLGVSLTRM